VTLLGAAPAAGTFVRAHVVAADGADLVAEADGVTW
jgi:hypothetical protein